MEHLKLNNLDDFEKIKPMIIIFYKLLFKQIDDFKFDKSDKVNKLNKLNNYNVKMIIFDHKILLNKWIQYIYSNKLYLNKLYLNKLHLNKLCLNKLCLLYPIYENLSIDLMINMSDLELLKFYMIKSNKFIKLILSSQNNQIIKSLFGYDLSIKISPINLSLDKSIIKYLNNVEHVKFESDIIYSNMMKKILESKLCMTNVNNIMYEFNCCLNDLMQKNLANLMSNIATHYYKNSHNNTYGYIYNANTNEQIGYIICTNIDATLFINNLTISVKSDKQIKYIKPILSLNVFKSDVFDYTRIIFLINNWTCMICHLNEQIKIIIKINNDCLNYANAIIVDKNFKNHIFAETELINSVLKEHILCKHECLNTNFRMIHKTIISKLNIIEKIWTNRNQSYEYKISNYSTNYSKSILTCIINGSNEIGKIGSRHKITHVITNINEILNQNITIDDVLIYFETNKQILINNLPMYFPFNTEIIGWNICKSHTGEKRIVKLLINAKSKKIMPISKDFLMLNFEEQTNSAIVIDLQYLCMTETSVMSFEQKAFGFVQNNESLEYVIGKKIQSNLSNKKKFFIHYYRNRQTILDMYANMSSFDDILNNII